MNWDNPLLTYVAFGIILVIGKRLRGKFYFNHKKRLLKLLDKSEKIAANYTGGYSGDLLSAEEFHSELATAISKYRNGDDTQLDLFYLWFAPTCAWDDFIGSEGENLANEIFELLVNMKKKAK